MKVTASAFYVTMALYARRFLYMHRSGEKCSTYRIRETHGTIETSINFTYVSATPAC